MDNLTKNPRTTSKDIMKKPHITEGEWTVLDAYEASFHNETTPRVETVFEVQSPEAGGTPCYATSEENAKAIAALPQCLAALTEALAYLDYKKPAQGSVDEVNHAQSRMHVVKALIAAGFTE